MTYSRKKSILRIWRNIVIITAVLIISGFVVTKAVYDAAFKRYDKIVSVDDRYHDFIERRSIVRFDSSGNELCGYLYGSGGRTLVVFVPGFRACADEYIAQIESLVSDGFGVFAFDYTGSSRSGGEDAVGFSQVICDLDAALAFVVDNNNFGYEKIALFGHSRGGYAVCCALGLDYDISAVVSVGGVNSAMEGIIEPVYRKIGYAAYSNYPMLWLYQVMLFGSDTVSSNAAEIVSESDVPTLIIHGVNDTQVSPEKFSVISHRDEISSDNVEYILCDEQGKNGHVDLLFDGDAPNGELMESISAFLSQGD